MSVAFFFFPEEGPPFLDMLFFFWGLRRVLVVAHGFFVEACGIFLLRRAGFSLVVACRFSLSSCGAQVPELVGSVVCSTRAL